MTTARAFLAAFLILSAAPAAAQKPQAPASQPEQAQPSGQAPAAPQTPAQQPQENPYVRQVNALPWQTTSGDIAQVARITLANDLRFLDQASTSRFLEINGNPPRANNFTVAPRSLEWFAIFSFDRSGYVRDDERLDADALLSTLREQNQAGMAERRRLNMPVLRLEGWAVAPHYDTETRRLEWGTRLIGDNNEVTVNYTIRILGRSGVMAATLVTEPQSLEHDVAQFRTALRNFEFNTGERYTEFRQGDRVAEYGLAALVVGGAAAAAASSGLLKGLGKAIGFLVFGGIAAVAAVFRRLFRRQ
jgi:uncharacterized membrane-anchored protein